MNTVRVLTTQATRMYRQGNVQQARVVWDNAIGIWLYESAKVAARTTTKA